MLSSGSLLTCGPGQQHMAQEVIGSREEPATLSCQADTLSKGPLSVCVDTPRLVLLPTLGSSECRGACTLAKAQGTFRKSGWERCKNRKAGKKWCGIFTLPPSAKALKDSLHGVFYTRSSQEDRLSFQWAALIELNGLQNSNNRRHEGKKGLHPWGSRQSQGGRS